MNIDLVQLIMQGGLPVVGAIAIVLLIWNFMRNASAAETRETNAAANAEAMGTRIGTLEKEFREEIVKLHKTTLESLNNNTMAVQSNTGAVDRLHKEIEKNHNTTSDLLNQIVAERCSRLNCPERMPGPDHHKGA